VGRAEKKVARSPGTSPRFAQSCRSRRTFEGERILRRFLFIQFKEEDHRNAHRIHRYRPGQDHLSPGCIRRAEPTEIEAITDEIERISNDDARCRQLRQIPGFGPLVSTATVAAIGNGSAFRRGRDFAGRKCRIASELNLT
jgi:transposase